MSLYESITLITAAIGAFTGVVSLLWHIIRSRPKLRIDSAYFKVNGENIIMKKEYVNISARITLRNTGDKSTTIEHVYVQIGAVREPDFFHPTTINANSSKIFAYNFPIQKTDYKKYFHNNKIKLGVTVWHTFGNKHKEAETSFETGHYTVS